MTIEKARITNVAIGNLLVEGVMLPDGSFGMAVPQIAQLFPYFQDDQNQAFKKLKRLMGKGFKTTKSKTEFNKNSTNVISLPEFERVVLELALKEDKIAIEFARMLVGLSLEQLWSDAFGIKFEKEERQKWLKFRQQHRKQFHPKLTYWFKVDGKKSGKDYAIAVNRFKACGNLPIKSVNEYKEEELQKLNELEIQYDILRKAGLRHEEAIKIIR